MRIYVVLALLTIVLSANHSSAGTPGTPGTPGGNPEYAGTQGITWTYSPAQPCADGHPIVLYRIRWQADPPGTLYTPQDNGTSTTFILTNVQSGIRYRAAVLAQDSAGTWSTQSGWSNWTVVDAAAPPAPTSPVSDFAYSTTGSVEWTWEPCWDTGGSKLKGYYLKIIREPDGYAIMDEWVGRVTTKRVSGLPHGFSYHAVLQAEDNRGNRSEWSIPSASVMVDTAPPQGTLSINSGSHQTTDLNLDLCIQASDSGSGVSGIRVSNDGVIWTEWMPPVSSLQWELPYGNGLASVFVQFRDHAGNVSEPVTDSIDLSLGVPPGQSGVTGGSGLNNIGLKIVAVGRFERVTDRIFRIDDGWGAVECEIIGSGVVDPAWEYVAVMGISSCKSDGSKLNKRILVGNSEDIIEIGN